MDSFGEPVSASGPAGMYQELPHTPVAVELFCKVCMATMGCVL